MTIVDSGELPAGTIISFHTGTVRRHAQVQNGKAIGVTGIGTEPVRVDLMAEIGSHTFDVKEGQDVYEVPIGKEETSLKPADPWGCRQRGAHRVRQWGLQKAPNSPDDAQLLGQS